VAHLPPAFQVLLLTAPSGSLVEFNPYRQHHILSGKLDFHRRAASVPRGEGKC
jgi:hypothetical protein